MIDLTSLPIGTKLRTRAGRHARLLATDMKGDATHPIACATENSELPSRELLMTYRPDGRLFWDGSQECKDDIVAVDRPNHPVRIVVFRRPCGQYSAYADHFDDPEYTSSKERFKNVVAEHFIEIEENLP